MKILVTGGSGFIGSHIVEQYHDKADVVVVDMQRHPNLNGYKHEFHLCSINRRNLVRSAMKGVDTVFHLAALTSVADSMEFPLEYLDTNIVGTQIVLEEAARANVRTFVYSSTAAVYSSSPEPKVESMCPVPISPYAISKLAGEYYCQLFSDRMAVKCLRYFNVFGPKQSGSYAAVIPSFIQRAIRNEPIEIHGDGEQTRDFIHIKNVVAANLLAAHPQVRGIINVGHGIPTTINRLAQDIIRLTGSSSQIVYKPARAGDVKHSTALVGRLYHEYGFTPVISYEEGLAETVSYFKDLYTKMSAGKTVPQ